jgi:mannose-6-phosphate isomerase-like protein (cupin superfamily)
MTSNKPTYDRLLAGIVDFVRGSGDPSVQRFRDGMENWGTSWTDVPPQHLAASDTLAAAAALAPAETRALVTLFAVERHHLFWEQSYKPSDGLVGDDMLAGYGFVEVIGKRGPFVSTRVRAGIGVWGPHIDYPAHDHDPEEVYVVLAGSAQFRLDGEAPCMRSAGEAVFVPSRLTHGLRTLADPLAVFYIWQGGDLRQTSRFDPRQA